MAAFRNRTFRGYSHERAPRCARAAYKKPLAGFEPAPQSISLPDDRGRKESALRIVSVTRVKCPPLCIELQRHINSPFLRWSAQGRAVIFGHTRGRLISTALAFRGLRLVEFWRNPRKERSRRVKRRKGTQEVRRVWVPRQAPGGSWGHVSTSSYGVGRFWCRWTESNRHNTMPAAGAVISYIRI